MKNLGKGKIGTILVIFATLILAGVAIYTAVRLYQLRQQPVAPNVPSSIPKAAAGVTCATGGSFTTTNGFKYCFVYSTSFVDPKTAGNLCTNGTSLASFLDGETAQDIKDVVGTVTQNLSELNAVAPASTRGDGLIIADRCTPINTKFAPNTAIFYDDGHTGSMNCTANFVAFDRSGPGAGKLDDIYDPGVHSTSTGNQTFTGGVGAVCEFAPPAGSCSLSFSPTLPTASPGPTESPAPTESPSPSPSPTASPTASPEPTATPTNQPTASPTAPPTQGPTASPAPNACGGTCGSNINCASGFVCANGFCRNPSCTSSTNCVCAPAATNQIAVATPAPTAPALPSSGTDWPTIVSAAFGVFVLIGAILLAL